MLNIVQLPVGDLQHSCRGRYHIGYNRAVYIRLWVITEAALGPDGHDLYSLQISKDFVKRCIIYLSVLCYL